MSSPFFTLRTLGALSLRRIDTGADELLNQRMRLALLAFVAAAPDGAVPRERVTSLFWPEADQLHARNSLNQLLYGIRRSLADDSVIDVSGALHVNSAVIVSDVQQFRAALAASDLAVAVGCYRGPFLDGVYLRDAPDFEQWSENTRRALSADYSSALERLITSALDRRDSIAAVQHARSLEAADRLGTRGAILMIRALASSGDVAGAIRHGHLYATLLRAELDVGLPREVDDELQTLRQQSSKPRPASPTHDVAERASAKPGDPIIETATPQLASSTTPPAFSRRTLSLQRLLLTIAGVAVPLLSLGTLIRRGQPRASQPAGRLIQLTIGRTAETDPVISPDGKWIAYAASRFGDARVGTNALRIFVRQVSGGRAVPITTDSTTDQRMPAWSPDGSRLAFRSPAGIFVVGALGGTPELLVAESGRRIQLGSWSHDGKRIAFADTLGVWIR
ncbi:MAG: BTAD domain-containing putative transcriptional regulator, partial [Longimicrobiales bacterium]